MNLSLFDDSGHGAPAGETFRGRLASRLKALTEAGVSIGTSSWKYDGWLGSIYTPERYATRGRFSRKKFESSCLAEYAETFPTVCGDFAFYQFPSPEYWRQLFTQAPALTFALKVPEEITVKTWPTHARYGARRGMENPSYLDAALFERALLEPLSAYRDRVTTLILEFGTFAKRQYESVEPFSEDLDRFLSALPKQWRYSVEVRNKEYLAPIHFETLRRHNAAHVFNAWTRMPELEKQVAMEDAYTADFVVARALLKHGRSFEEGVQKFQPYREVQEPNPAARDALRRLMKRAEGRKVPGYIYINNRFEGNAPGTIDAVTTDADAV